MSLSYDIKKHILKIREMKATKKKEKRLPRVYKKMV